ncbi:tyrosine-type recombinase/integrase [Peptacetobacter sp. AB845]|uniref:tyrosine-type recombinase/integrase n=1 Tax=Peptacetobacter sp. AB845 TaxID=3388429 RepID=UPI0039C9EB4E
MSKRANGEGSITFYSSRNCYRGQLTIGIDEKGKAKRKSFYGKTKKEVKEKMDNYKLLNPIGAAAINEYTVATWFNYWIWNIKKRDIKPTTFARYESVYRTHIEGSEIANIPLYKLKLNNIQAYYNKLLDNGTPIATIKQINSKLKTCLDSAEKNNYIEKNYCKLVEIPTDTKDKKIEVFSVDQQKQFAETVKGHKLELLFLTALCTGLRIGEISGLKWSDIDFDNHTLTVNRTVERVALFDKDGKRHYETIEQTPKTSNGFRTVPIVSYIFNRLLEHKVQQDAIKREIPNFNEYDLIFCDKKGYYLNPNSIGGAFHRIQNKMNIPKDEHIKFHGLRKTFATRLFEKGVPPKTVQTLLGHSDIEITLNIYTQVMENKKVEAINELESIF